MILVTHCNSCRIKFSISSKAKNRQQLVDQYRWQMNFTCPFCHNPSIYQPNEVYAEVQNVRALPGTGIGGGIGWLAGPLGFVIGLVGGTAVAWSIEQKSVNDFNHSSAWH